MIMRADDQNFLSQVMNIQRSHIYNNNFKSSVSSEQEWIVEIESYQMVHIVNNTHLWSTMCIKKLVLGFMACCLAQVPELVAAAITTNQQSRSPWYNQHYHTRLTFFQVSKRNLVFLWSSSSYQKKCKYFIKCLKC